MQVPGLYSFFRRQIQQGFGEQGLAQPALVDYVSGLLTRFSRVSEAFPFQDADGRPIETIAGLLVQWQTAWCSDTPPPGRVREALMLHHIGDYALFMSGVFRERLKCRGQIGYYRDQGQSAFARCARLEPDPQSAAVLRRVSRDFDPISHALDRLWHRRLPIAMPADCTPLTALWRA